MSTHARSLAGLAALALLAACGGGTPTPTVAPATPTAAVATAAPTATVTAVPATAAPPTAAPPTILPPTPATGTGAQVDLAFSGTRVFFAVGTNGACKLDTVDGVTTFGFEATFADYPALGQSFAITELETVSITWTLDANLAYENNPGVIIEISPDHRTVTLDQDLAPISSGGNTPGPQHIKGTITCS